jgi:hypothetical protein
MTNGGVTGTGFFTFVPTTTKNLLALPEHRDELGSLDLRVQRCTWAR